MHVVCPCVIYCVIFGNCTLVRYLALARCAIFIMHALLLGLRLRVLFRRFRCDARVYCWFDTLGLDLRAKTWMYWYLRLAYVSWRFNYLNKVYLTIKCFVTYVFIIEFVKPRYLLDDCIVVTTRILCFILRVTSVWAYLWTKTFIN